VFFDSVIFTLENHVIMDLGQDVHIVCTVTCGMWILCLLW